ncbi:hypothetical protein J5754_00175 [bacterium]|nr:hypothetical protein [bacterium]
MNTKLLSFVLCLGAMSLFANKFDVHVQFESDLYGTNYVTDVEPGKPFSVTLKRDPTKRISRFLVTRQPEQFKRYSKNVSLIVGVDEYNGDYLPKLATCVADTTFIRGVTDVFCNHQVFLKNADATRDRIENEIKSAADKLEPGDTFFYYHSARGYDEIPGVACYDGFLFVENLDTLFQHFKDGVNIIVMLDAEFADKMTDMFNETTCVVTGNKPIKKKWKTDLSPFTYAVMRSVSAQTDDNKDGLLSFMEMYQRAHQYTRSVKQDQDVIVRINCDIEKEVYFCDYQDRTTDGTIYVENSQITASVDCVNSYTYIYIEETGDSLDPTIDIKKSTYKKNIKKGEAKFTIDYTAKTYSVSTPGFEINGTKIFIGPEYKTSKSGSHNYVIEDYWFKKIGSCQIKEDLKKGGYTCKLSVKSDSDLNDVFSDTTGSQAAQILTRYFYDSMHARTIFYNVVSKNGKTLTATYKK